MQRLRGTRLVHFYGVGDCVFVDGEDEHQEGEGPGPLIGRARARTTADDAEPSFRWSGPAKTYYLEAPWEAAVSGDGPPAIRAKRDSDDASKTWDFVVVEFMPGGSLADRIRRAAKHGVDAAKKSWPWDERLRILCDVAEGMAQMHAKRYIHRDLPVQLLQSPSAFSQL